MPGWENLPYPISAGIYTYNYYYYSVEYQSFQENQELDTFNILSLESSPNKPKSILVQRLHSGKA